LLDVDAERVSAWLVAGAVAEPRDIWRENSVRLARAVRA
jgi:hypothetical protein